MADTTTTGAETAVTVDNTAVADKRKKLIKYVVIGVIIVVLGLLVYKYILKK